MIDVTGSRALLEVDGGVNLENANRVVKAGADVLVSGSAIFHSDDFKQTIHQMRTSSQTVTV